MPDARCPFLRDSDNPDLYSPQANDDNACFRHGNPQAVLHTHQDQFCLSDEFNGCPVYQYQAGPFRNQVYLQAKKTSRTPKPFSILMYFSLAASLLVLVCLVLFSMIGGPARVLARNNVPSPTPSGGKFSQGNSSDGQDGGLNGGSDLFASVRFAFITQTPTATSLPPSETPSTPTATLELSTPTPSATTLIELPTTTPPPTSTATVFYLPTLPRPTRTPTRRPTSTSAPPSNPPTNPPPTEAPPTEAPPTQPPPPTSPPVIQPTNPPPPPPTEAPSQPPRLRPTPTPDVP